MNTDNLQMELEPELAKKILHAGAVLIIAGVPVGTIFGIDLCSYTIDQKFRGIKMIPPGLHYVWCSSKGRYGDIAPRVGFVHFFKSKDIVVREWDCNNEELRERQIKNPELEKQRICENLYNLDKFLAPYDYRYICKWHELTDVITEDTMQRCQPALGTVRTNIELQSCPDTDRPRGEIRTVLPQGTKAIVDENDLLPQLKPIEGTAPLFTELPKRVPINSDPEAISRHSMDCVVAVDTLLNIFSSTEKLIEEIQLAFIFYLVGHSLESLAHWRKNLHLLSHSEMAVKKYKTFFLKYSKTLTIQLPYLPEELMEAGDHNTVYKDIRSLLVNLYTNELNGSAEEMSKKLKNALGWDFPLLMDEDPENQPVIVETEESLC